MHTLNMLANVNQLQQNWKCSFLVHSYRVKLNSRLVFVLSHFLELLTLKGILSLITHPRVVPNP